MLNRHDYPSIKAFLEALTSDPTNNQLAEYFEKNPQLICLQDEEGQTLIHHVKHKIILCNQEIAEISENLANGKYSNIRAGVGFMAGLSKSEATLKAELRDDLTLKVSKLMKLEMRMHVQKLNAIRTDITSYLRLLPPPVAGEIRKYMAYKAEAASPPAKDSTAIVPLTKSHV